MTEVQGYLILALLSYILANTERGFMSILAVFLGVLFSIQAIMAN